MLQETTAGPSSTQLSGGAGSDYSEGRRLDGFLLLAAGGSSRPDDVVTANLSSLNIVDIASGDLSFFGNLDSLDISDNKLSYEHIFGEIAVIPRLSNLVLSCNSISSLEVPLGSFKHLLTLDLSFNELHGDVLIQLARLPRLTKLNLSSNCISSVPPEEELYGMHALEELNLDANDLVQFDQWRALDALPRLVRLSLASNRIKRLKDDDAPEDGTACSYFVALEVLDLSSNEIVDVHSLPVVWNFRVLSQLHLSDNPCTRDRQNGPRSGRAPPFPRIRGAEIIAEDTKPWYLRNGGCFMKRQKKQEPRLRLDHRQLKRVPTKLKKVAAGRNQVGQLDNATNQLVFDLRGIGGPDFRSAPRSSYKGDDDSGDPSFFITAGQSAAAIDLDGCGVHRIAPGSKDLPTNPALLSDDLSDEELDDFFRRRRESMEQRLAQPVEEPSSFMKAIPFKVTAAAGRRLGFTKEPLDDDNSCASGAAGSKEAPLGLSGSPSRTSTVAFLSYMDDPDTSPSAGSGRREGRDRTGTGSSALGSQRPAALLELPSSASSEPDRVSLPPLPGASRTSSHSDVLAEALTGGPGGMPSSKAQDKKSAPVNVDVREAMKALRAAMNSEYASG